MKEKLTGLLAGIVGLVLLGGDVAAQDLSPKAEYNHVPQFQYGRGRVAHPRLQFNLDEAPKVEFPNVTLDSYDSRAEGKLVAPFRNQKSCGSCWDFSGIRIIAYARLKAGLNPFQLSEQYVLDCVPCGGCNGDDNTTVLKAAKGGGIPADADYQTYHAAEGRCQPVDPSKHIQIKDWVLVDGDNYDRPGDTQKIMNAIYATGAVGCAVAAGPSWNGYSAGVHRGNSSQIDHDVVLTGWQKDPTIPEGGWWWMDNSWSEQWGIGGRMKIAFKADMIGTEPVAVILDMPPPPPAPPVPVGGGESWTVLVVLGVLVVALVVGTVLLVRKYKVVAR